MDVSLGILDPGCRCIALTEDWVYSGIAVNPPNAFPIFVLPNAEVVQRITLPHPPLRPNSPPHPPLRPNAKVVQRINVRSTVLRSFAHSRALALMQPRLISLRCRGVWPPATG